MKIIQISAIWCNSCLVMDKIYKEIKKEIEIIWEIYDLDFDSEEIKDYNDLEKLPVLIFVKNNKEVSRLIGEHKKEEVIKWIKENI